MDTLAEIYIIVSLRTHRRLVFASVVIRPFAFWKGKAHVLASYVRQDRETSKQTNIGRSAVSQGKAHVLAFRTGPKKPKAKKQTQLHHSLRSSGAQHPVVKD
jgi:hypothetical protein